MLHAFILVMLVTFNGVGNPPQSGLLLTPTLSACKQVEADAKRQLDADDKVAGYSLTCVPAEVALPATKA